MELWTALLAEQHPLGDNAAASCLDTLRGVLRALGEPERAHAAVRALRPRYRAHPRFEALQRGIAP